MIGKRHDADENGNLRLEDGEYGKDCAGNWYAKPPGFDGYANLTKHKVDENSDGIITVSPSIKVENHTGMWHGYLSHGVWREIV